MKPLFLLGLMLVVLGVAAMAYQGFSFTTEETILQIGALKATAEVEKEIAIPNIVAVISIVAGIIIIALQGRGK
jgi:hypothetical protein